MNEYIFTLIGGLSSFLLEVTMSLPKTSEWWNLSNKWQKQIINGVSAFVISLFVFSLSCFTEISFLVECSEKGVEEFLLVAIPIVGGNVATHEFFGHVIRFGIGKVKEWAS